MGSLPRESPEILERLQGAGRGELKAFLAARRWFAAKARGVAAVRVEDWALLDADIPLVLALLDVDGERYYLPLAGAREAAPDDVVGRIGTRAIVDAHADPAFARRLLGAIASGAEVPARAGRFVFRPMAPWSGPAPERVASLDVRRVSGEQSNTSVALGQALMLKSLRRLRRGMNPELEITGFLTSRTRFRDAPALVGWVDYDEAAGETSTVSVLQTYVDNAGDGWRHTVTALERAWRSNAPSAAARSGDRAILEPLTRDMRELGAVTGRLHAALASDRSLPAFAPEPVTPGDVLRWASRIAQSLASLAADTSADPAVATEIAAVSASGVDHCARLRAALDPLVRDRTNAIRVHGDYHLGQTLKTRDSFAVIDFEGEPARSLEERRAKESPLKDVAGMLRSLDYAVNSARLGLPPAERDAARAWLGAWERRARDAFVDGYAEAIAVSPVPLIPRSREDLLRACAVFEVEKACYELAYELNNRPDWAPIPLAGLARLLSGARAGA